jgi:hypothetical protein
MEPIRYRPDGLIDCEFYRSRSRQRHDAYVREFFSEPQLRPFMTPRTRRGLRLFSAAFAIATGAFWATMLTSPPVTQAGNPPLSIHSLQGAASLDLPMLQVVPH